MTTALILVDLQNDYFPGGANPLVGSDAAVAQAKALLDTFRTRSLPRIFIQHLSTRPGATFFLPNTPGAEIHPVLQPRPGEVIFQKHFPNSFRETPLLAYLKENAIDRLVICGMMTHMCIDTTVRAAADLGFPVLLAGDACATKDLSYDGQTIPAHEVHGAFLAALNGSFARVLPSADLLAQLEAAE